MLGFLLLLLSVSRGSRHSASVERKRIFLAGWDDDCFQGEAVDLTPLRLAVNMLTSLRPYVEQPVYSDEFEEPFLDATRKYYEQEAAEYIAAYSATDFLKQVHTNALRLSCRRRASDGRRKEEDKTKHSLCLVSACLVAAGAKENVGRGGTSRGVSEP